MRSGITILFVFLFWASAFAAFPTVEATNTSAQNSSTTTQPVALPAGIVSGNLLIAIVTVTHDATGTNPDTYITDPAGWTNICEQIGSDLDGTGDIVTKIFKRQADGSEGSTLNVTTASRRGTHQSYRISGHNDVAEVECADTNSSSTTDVDPPDLAPSWGAADNLWIAVAAKEQGNDATPSLPSGFTDAVHATGDTTSNLRNTTTSARKAENVSSQNPAAFVYSSQTSFDWVGATIAIRGIAAAATGGPQRRRNSP